MRRYISSGSTPRREQLPRDRVAARRRVAEPEAAGVGQNRDVERARDGGVISSPSTCAKSKTSSPVAHAVVSVRDHRPGGLVRRQVMVDHERRGTASARTGVGERAEPLHVADVEHDEQIDAARAPRRPRRVRSSHARRRGGSRTGRGHGVGFTMRAFIPRCASSRASAASEPQPSPSALMCVEQRDGCDRR